MAADDAEVQWPQPRGVRAIHVVAVLVAVLAAGSVLLVFNRMSGFMGHPKPQSQLIANIDLRLGNTILAAQRGEAQARADIEAGLLQLQTFDPEKPATRAEAAKARQLKQRYGITWLHRTEAITPVSQAVMDGYNRVVKAEIERRHGRGVLEQVLPKEDTHSQAGG